MTRQTWVWRRAVPLAVVAAGCLIAGGAPSAFARDKAMPAPDWAVAAAKTPTPTTVGDAAAVVLFDE
jgi:hypothetical protein